MVIKLIDKYIEKYIKDFEEAYITYKKEFKQHNIEGLYKEKPQKYQQDMDGMKAIEEAYQKLIVNKKPLNLTEANNLFITANTLMKELDKYDIVMVKKGEIRYWNYIITLKIIASYYIGKNTR